MATSALRVFIGSAMTELRDVRDIIRSELEVRGISAFVYESAAGAQPETVVDTSLRELLTCDVFVGIFWQRYPKVTIQEFTEARRVGKPCFIYLRDKDTEREPELESFLQAEVYDLKRGVSYDFFDSAVKLSRRISDDVMAWLVRRNRELTAELLVQRVSNDELRKVQIEAQRLQGSSREPLPRGTAADRLASDLRGWFAALGYGIEREVERSDKSFDWLINISERRGYARVLVHGVEGEAELGDFRAVESALEREHADEGWLVAVRRVSQAVRDLVNVTAKRKVFPYSLDELLDEVADFDKYFDWLDAEVRRREIDKAYVYLSAAKDEYHPETGSYLGRASYGRENGWLEGYIDRWLADPSKEHISILGEFGTGKTSFALHYAWIARQRYREAQQRGLERPRVPLVIPLRDYAKAVTVESLFSEFFFRKYEMLPGYSAFEQLNRMGKLLLIFDGFDEMAAKVDRQEMINNFWRLAQVVVPGSKAILTCRTEHFPEAKEGRALLGAELKASTANLTGEPPQFEVLELERLDDGQIRELLGYHTDTKTVEAIMGNPPLRDLARRPVMASYILEALPDIKAGKPVDLARVYLYAITRKMERDIESGRTFTSLADKLYFLCEVAWEMLSTDAMSLNYRQFPDRLANLFGDAVKAQKDLDHWHFDMMGQSLLVRNAEGDYTPAHRSLLEFFVAYKFAAELGMLAPDFTEPAKKQAGLDSSVPPRLCRWSAYFRRPGAGDKEQKAPLLAFEREDLPSLDRTFGRRPITPAVAQLMESMLADNSVEQLLKIVTETNLSPKRTAFTGGNAITVLLRKNRSALRGRKFNDTNLDHADFAGADLTGCDFRCASLRRATIRSAALENVQLQEADVTDLTIEESEEVTAVSVSPDGKSYAAGYYDGTVRVGDVETGNERLAFRPHERDVTHLVWSPDEAHILSGGEDGQLEMWNAFDGSVVFSRPAYQNWVTCIALVAGGTRIITSGGMEASPVKLWDIRGKLLGRWDVPGDQANWVSLSRDGHYLATSYWDRRERKGRGRDTGVAVFHCSKDGTLSQPFILRGYHGWRVLFTNTRPSFLTVGRDGKVVINDAENGIRSKLPIKGSPMCISESDELLAIWVNEEKEIKLEIWYLPSPARLATLGFGPKSGSRSDPFRRCVACFTPDGSRFVGGSDDCTMRIWDTKLFCPASAALVHLGESVVAKRKGLKVPDRMQMNPEFTKLLRVVERKINCKGLQLVGTRGLATIKIAGMKAGSPESSESEQDVIQWFRERGAVVG